MIGKNDKYKNQNVTCVYKATIQSLVVLSIRHHCMGYPTQEPPKRSWDSNYIMLQSDRNIINGRLWYVRRETLQILLQLSQCLCSCVLRGR